MSIQIYKFRDENKHLHLQDGDPVYVAKDLKMPQFEMEKVLAKVCDNKIHMGDRLIHALLCSNKGRANRWLCHRAVCLLLLL
jgi:hypothetical protein